MIRLIPPEELLITNSRFNYLKATNPAAYILGGGTGMTFLCDKPLVWRGETSAPPGTPVIIHQNRQQVTQSIVQADGTFTFSLLLEHLGEYDESSQTYRIPNNIIRAEAAQFMTEVNVTAVNWVLTLWIMAQESTEIIDLNNKVQNASFLFPPEGESATLASFKTVWGDPINAFIPTTGMTAEHYKETVQDTYVGIYKNTVYDAYVNACETLFKERPTAYLWEDQYSLVVNSVDDIVTVDPPTLTARIEYGIHIIGTSTYEIEEQDITVLPNTVTYVYVDGELNPEGYLVLKTTDTLPDGVAGMQYKLLGVITADATSIVSITRNLFWCGNNSDMYGQTDDMGNSTIVIEFKNNYSEEFKQLAINILKFLKPASSLVLLKFVGEHHFYKA